MLPGSSVRLKVLDDVRSFDATVRWCMASESEAGARNRGGAFSCTRNDGDADISWSGFRTMRGGARKKHMSSPDVIGKIKGMPINHPVFLPFGPNTPCDVLGSASVLSFRNWEYAASSFWAEDALRLEVSSCPWLKSSMSEDPVLLITRSPSLPNNKNRRQASRHGRCVSRITRSLRSMKARSFSDIREFLSKSMVGVPFGPREDG